MFHEPDELNAAFLTTAVRNRPIWVRPSDIGPLPDDRDHHLSFEPGSPWTFFSEPRRLETKRLFETVLVDAQKRLRERGRTDLAHDDLEDLSESIAIIAEKRREIGKRQKAVSREVIRDAPPLRRIAYYASVFLEAQLFVVQERHRDDERAR